MVSVRLVSILGYLLSRHSAIVAPETLARQSIRSAGNFLSSNALSRSEYAYGLMLDAGSSGTRLHMFRWTFNQQGDLAELMPRAEDSDRFTSALMLASFAENPAAAGPAMMKIVDPAIPYIPDLARNGTSLFVKATAGMRLLETSKAQAILDEVRGYLSNKQNCPFRFVSADIISGEEESIFTYVSTNYYLQRLSPKDTVGAIEMGGASMQVVFNPTTDVRDNEFQFYMKGIRHTVYAKSYIRFGADEAVTRFFERVASDRSDVTSPCHNSGFKETASIAGRNVTFTGAANVTRCIELVRKLLGLDVECLMPPCALRGSYMAKLNGSFYALAGFFYTVFGLGLIGWDEAKVLTLSGIATARDTFCAKDLEDAIRDTKSPAKFVRRYCFLAVYLVETLAALGFEASDTSVTYSRKISNYSLGWTTGAILYETQLMPLDIHAGIGRQTMCGDTDAVAQPPNLHGQACSYKVGRNVVLAMMIMWLRHLSQAV